jgi:hypothetical protein
LIEGTGGNGMMARNITAENIQQAAAGNAPFAAFFVFGEK